MTILCNYFTSTNLYHVCVIYRYLQKLRPQKAFLIKFEFESDKKKNCVLKCINNFVVEGGRGNRAAFPFYYFKKFLQAVASPCNPPFYLAK